MQNEEAATKMVSFVISGVVAVGGIGLLRYFLTRSLNDMIKGVEDKYSDHKINVIADIASLTGDIRRLFERSEKIPVIETEITSIKNTITEIKADCKEKHRGHN